MIWIILGLMAALAVALLIVPLWRARPKPAARLDYDLAVYKDQLAELDREIERGVLTADQAEAARTEIQRRMLTAADQAEAATAPARRPLGAALAVVVTVPVLAFGLYSVLGNPGLPDQPASARPGQMQEQAAMIQNMMAGLEEKLRQNPNDGKGWSMLGRSYRVMGQLDKAASAYAKALPLLPGDANVRLEYASLLLDRAPETETMLPAEFVAVMREVLTLAPDNGDAMYFVGLAEAQAGRPAKAKALWTRLLDKLPPGSQERAQVEQMIGTLK